VLAANGIDEEGYLRLVLTRGVGPRSWEPQGYRSPNVIIYAARGRLYPPQEYERGWQAIVSSYRQDQLSLLCRLKTLNFLPRVLARREARARGADEALHLNLLGHVAEGTTTNVFLVRGGQVITPDVASGLLPGITRAAVLALAAQRDISVVERPVGLEELRQAEEAFLTSSLLGIMPLVALEGRPIGCGRPGPVTRQLQQAYQETVKG
jgi:branched-subunit amino acid aminotransferase/4-amino-4-deoxychorismate lyase